LEYYPGKTSLEEISDENPPDNVEFSTERAPPQPDEVGVEGLQTGDHLGFHTLGQEGVNSVTGIPVVANTLADLSLRDPTVATYDDSLNSVHPNYHFLALARGRDGLPPVLTEPPTPFPTSEPTPPPTLPTQSPTSHYEEYKTSVGGEITTVDHVYGQDGTTAIDTQTVTLPNGATVDKEVAKYADGSMETTTSFLQTVSPTMAPTMAPTVPTAAPSEPPAVEEEEEAAAADSPAPPAGDDDDDDYYDDGADAPDPEESSRQRQRR
jgi:hypothetical protein